ncbi:hypothetical protein TrVE_jg12660 [Triparma verrucosa]|uniref:Histone acetyltransferase n=1 Tax=Triparma verrucosa TaxID=1606542 RepID=A0A9W7C1M7_9STRA|nr:hypothetical protein TrVE_jg12660 [Triparma verrucosa]
MTNPPAQRTRESTSQASTPRSKASTPKGPRKDPDAHPWSRGSIITVIYTLDGTPRMCDIIERQELDGSTPENPLWKYYIHYQSLNRRMDEWILPTPDRVIELPSVAGAKHRALKAERKKKDDERRREEEKRRQEKEMQILEQEAEEGTRRTRRKKKEEGEASPRPGEPEEEGGFKEGLVNTMAVAEIDEHEGMDEASLREHEEVTKVKNVGKIELGRFCMDTWYFSPFPKHFFGASIDILYVCEFTLNFFTSKSALLRFQSRPDLDRHPPGNEIYRKGNLSMFEVDGGMQREYCQNLCYIAKLFLDHKTLYYDVDPFLFYVLCEVDDRGFHPVGYYSKEKYSDVGYNLACILTFPCHQRKGYGRFLIAFSYLLTIKEEKVGSPEKPMSDLGQQAYKPFWTSTIVDYLVKQGGRSHISIMDISKETSIMAEDIIFSLNQVGILKFIDGEYFISAEEEILEHLAKKHPVKKPFVDPECLHWTPYLTDVKRDKFSIHNKRPTYGGESTSMEVTGEFGSGRGSGSGAMGR